ncbi:MAG: hypothetical protein QY314_03945 [Candidatus Dojkabacteria bacterium]|nr:MAG: hypothetical protein QY314_03945 [Candidatus Dojkabacteria bacterium]
MLVQILQYPAIALLKVAMWVVALTQNAHSHSVSGNMLDWDDKTTRVFWAVMVIYIVAIVVISLFLSAFNLWSGIAFFIVMVASSFALFGTPSASSKQ